mmetsp:Transcript_22399/g.76072  ORF Transcript_22399/g.76072 Transcript_22399/m.76072 type:complete len:474 (+) Transcript_22399:35-1456(+)
MAARRCPRGVAAGVTRRGAARGSTTSARAVAAEHHAELAAVNASWDRLGRWLAEGDGDGGLEAGLQVAYCRMGPADVRGIVSASGAGERDRLLAVPMSKALLEGVTEGLDPPFGGAPWPLAFGARLLRERALGEASAMAPYVDILPTTVESPLALPLASAEAELQYAPALAALRELHALVDLASENAAGDGGRDEWRWAVAAVLSRTLRMRGQRMMLPAVDMLNHGGEQKNITVGVARGVWDTGPGAGTVLVLATREVAPGEQVLFTYGNDRSNDDFFLYYGFVLAGNPNDTFVLFSSVREAVEWHGGGGGGAAAAAERATAEALGQASAGELGEAFPRAPLRTMGASGDEASEFVRAPFRLHLDAIGGAEDVVQPAPEMILRADGKVDARLLAAFAALAPEGEDPGRHAASRVRDAASEALGQFPTTEAQDTELLEAGGFATWPDELLVAYRREKKRVLAQVVEACDRALGS